MAREEALYEVKSMQHPLITGALVASAFGSVCAEAETVEYRYDALGRIVEVTTTGGPNSAEAAIAYDAAGNRRIYSTSVVSGGVSGGGGSGGGNGGSAPPAQQSYVVVPLNGLMVIPMS